MNKFEEEFPIVSQFLKWGVRLVIGFFAFCLIWTYVGPIYGVWEQGLTGESELKRASWNRQIAVQEAEAKKEAAKSLAEAEVIRAGGVAKANAIISDSLKGNEAYLHYLWIQALEHSKASLIYVPTEAQLPLLEANRLNK